MRRLDDYVKIYKWLDDDFCKNIILELNSVKWDQHTFYHDSGEYVKRSGDLELDVSYDYIPSKDRLTEEVWKAIGKYILEDFNNEYFAGWSGFTNIRFNRYNKNKLMALHCDHIHDMFDGKRKGIPILTVLGSLNNDYEGGELLMFDEEKEYKMNVGEIMIFPSNFLYPHRVAPVTKGIRDTFVSWVW